ncbi:MAG TPA: EVE domain-containing protein [Acidimicrobiia bacterium]
MKYWLYKSEPTSYSIDDLARDHTTVWDGVRNFIARAYLVQAEVGDLAFFYHSSANPPGIAGLCRVVKAKVVDPTQFDPTSKYFDARATTANPRWHTVVVEFVEKFREFLPLERLRATFPPEELPILRRGSRLSVTPVPEETATRLLAMLR